jgi:hypothetical protein
VEFNFDQFLSFYSSNLLNSCGGNVINFISHSMQFTLNKQKQYLSCTYNLVSFHNIEVRIFSTMTFVDQISNAVNKMYENENEHDVARVYLE